MRKLLSKVLSVFIIIGYISLNAQKADTKSKQILDAVSLNYKKNKNSYFKFAYGTGYNGKVTKTETGIFYTTSSQYKLKVMGTEQIFDGQKVYNISAEDQEITIAKGNNTDSVFSPVNYIDSYKKEYNAEYIGKKAVNGTYMDLIKLTPIKNNGLKFVNIYINTAKNQIIKIEQYSNDNSLAVITIDTYKANQKLNPELFKFNKENYKNFLITEL